MEKVIVLLVLMTVSLTAQAKQAEICKLKDGNESSGLINCEEGDILSFYGRSRNVASIARTTCDFTQAVDHMIASTKGMSRLHCVYIGYQRTERK